MYNSNTWKCILNVRTDSHEGRKTRGYCLVMNVSPMANPGTEEVATGATNKRWRKDFTAEEVRHLITELLLRVKPGDQNFTLQKGAISQLSAKFNCHRNTVSNIWKKACANKSNPDIGFFARHHKRRNVEGNRKGTEMKYHKLLKKFLCIKGKH